jgi:EmrB/QacA subfamily drug resistance transporter
MNRTIPLILAVALFMEQMDTTVIATALPAIAADVGTSPIALKLALTSYLVAVAIFIPVSGWVADRFGARRVFAVAIAVFVLGSVTCALAGTLGEFVMSRFLQGMGGALMTPVARLVLVRTTSRANLVQGLAWLTIPALFGPLAGPPVGGFLTSYFSWHWIFILNVPIGIAGIVGAFVFLPRDEPHEVGRVDWVGFALAGLAASGIVFGFSLVSLPVLPPWVGYASVAVGVISTGLYIPHARRHPAPLLDLRLFANPVFRNTMLGSSIFRIGAGAVPFLLPLMLQLTFGMTPFQSGMVTFVSAGGALAMKFIIRWMLEIGGFRTVLAIGAALTSVMIAANGFLTPATPLSVVLAVLFAGGLARSMLFTSANALSFAEITDGQMAQATAITSAGQQIAIAIGVAIGGGILDLQAGPAGELGLAAFHNAFFIVGGLTVFAVFAFLSLPPGAGDAVSGHQIRTAGHRAAAPVRMSD